MMSAYRSLALLSLLLPAPLAAGPAAPGLDPVTSAGAWSKVVDGLQGRLLVSEGTPFNNTGMPVVYLELRNVSDVGNPMEIYYDTGKGVTGILTNEAGAAQPQAGLPTDIMMPFPYWLALPYDGTLRFRVSVTGYGVPKGARALIGMLNDAWLIQAGDRGRYFLSGRFDVTPPQDPAHIHAWKGTLGLPKVGVPMR